jgi:glycosyltransferase involved in cell wall biosynthesis
VPEGRQLCAVSTGNPEKDRFDVLVHALAELSDDVTLRLCDVRDRTQLELLARGYGIDDRIEFAQAPNGAATLVSYAGANGAAAEDGRVLFDPAGDPLEPSDGLTLAELVHLAAGEGGSASLHDDDSVLAGARVILITNLPAPYRTPLFSAVARRLAAVGAEFRVLFLADSDDARPWITPGTQPAFEFDTLRSVRMTRGARPKLFPANLEAALWRFRPTIVVCGGLSPAVALRAWVAARRARAAFGVWSGDHLRMPTAQQRVRARTRRFVARRADFALAYGSLSAEYLRVLNDRLPTVIARNTSDLAGQPRPATGNAQTLRLLAVGDLASPRKGIDVLVSALALLPELDCRLTVVGSGALLDDFSQAAAHDSRVTFAGALPPTAVAAAYADADVFLFPSREDVFGLALVEAMHAGLAVISAVAPGATSDLCVNGVNSLLVAGHQPHAWATAIRALQDDPGMRTRLAAAAQRSIDHRWTADHSADAFIAGLRLGSLVRGGG